MTPMALVLLLVSSAALFGVGGASQAQHLIPVSLKEAQWASNARIIGGKTAEQGQFPYQVAMFVNGVFACGGSIISPTFILTAAHCVLDPGTYTIRAGSVMVNQGQEYRVKRLIKHPGYEHDPQKYYPNDIALLELSSPLNIGGAVQIVQLARSTPQLETAAQSSGWGQTHPHQPIYPDQLQYFENKIVNAPITQSAGRLFIFKGVGTGLCGGDSGGPTVIQGPVQVGVHSFVLGDCGSGSPDAVTNVAHYYNWIQQNMH